MMSTIIRGCILLSLISLGGCGDTLFYGERTGFNLAIRADAANSTPVEVNAGLRRSVVGVVPPLQHKETEDGSKKPEGEAANMVSRFELLYVEGSLMNSLFGGELVIQSRFASGEAAKNVAEEPGKVGAVIAPSLVRSGDWASEATINTVDELIDKASALDDRNVIALATNPPVVEPEVDDWVNRKVDADNKRVEDRDVAFLVLKNRIFLTNEKFLPVWKARIDAAAQ